MPYGAPDGSGSVRSVDDGPVVCWLTVSGERHPRTRDGNLGLVRERVLDVRDVPVRLYEAGTDELLLFGHRGTLSKDHDWSVRWCRRLAAATGLSVVSIDAQHHGERAPRTGDVREDQRLAEEAIVSGGEQAAADWQFLGRHVALPSPPAPTA